MFSGATKTNNVVSTVPAATDPYFYDVTLLLNGDGTNGSQNNTFLDSSTNAITVTRNGTATQGTFTPFGNLWSNYFDGTNNLSIPYNAAFDYGTGNFSIEAWVYLTVTPVSGACIFGSLTTGGTDFQFYSATQIALGTNFVAWRSISNSVTFNLFTWYHVAVTRISGVAAFYQNGTYIGGGTETTNFNAASGAVTIGKSSDNTVTGYISNVRVVKGGSAYNGPFTPSTTPLTTSVASGTVSLLTCQSSRFVDNSINNFTVTPSGTPSVQRFSPFNPTSAYSTSVIGGGGYFNGSTDALQVASNAQNALGTGDFTIELWLYWQSGGNSRPNLIGNRSSASSQTAWNLYIASSKLGFGSVTTDFVIGTTTLAYNTWYHVAVSRASGTIKMWLNGVQEGASSTGNTNNFSDTSPIDIGAQYQYSTNYFFSGSLSNIRIVKGGAIYTSNFTPPTSPLTTTVSSGTVSLLLNETNAGIPDYAMQNDLITQGAAQVSTTQAKFGTGSISYNGTTSYLRIPSSYLASFGTGNFTIEMWIYPTSLPANSSQSIFANWPTGTPYTVGQFNFFVGAWSTGVTSISFSYATTTTSANNISSGTGSNAITVNAWNFVSVIRNGTALTIYVNGTSVVSTTLSTSTVIGVNSTATSGSTLPTGSDYFAGYIDDLRVTKGYARPTTTPTATWPLY